MGYLFDTSKGESPEMLKRQREIVRALMGAQRAPQNVGEGLSALGDGIVANVLGSRADAAEKAGMESAASAMGPLSGMFGGGAQAAGGTPAPSPSPYAGMADGPKGQEAYAAPSGGGDIESYIRQAAQARGIDPDVAVRVAQSEGGLKDPVRQSDYVKNGKREESYGPFQLYLGGGLGNKAMEAGIDPRNPEHWQKGVDFALDEAAQKGWGQWYGAARAGIDNHAGLDRAQALGMQPPTQVASLDPSAGMPPTANAMVPPDAAAPGQQAIARALAEQGIDPNGPQAQAFASIGAGGGQPSPVAQALAQPQPQQAPMQVAQADMPMGGGQGAGPFPAAPPDPNSGEGHIRQLLAAAQNPWLSESQQAIVKALLGEEMQKRDPAYKMGLEKSQLELDALKHPKPEYGFITGKDGSIFRSDKGSGTIDQVYGGKPDTFRMLTPDEETKMGLDPAGAYQMGTDNKVSKVGGEGTTVNIDQKAEGAFEKKLGEKQAETFDAMSTEGMNAKAELGVIGELDNLLKGQGGTLTGVAGMAAKYGLGGEGMDDLQATQAIINKLIPSQRQPGSGTMSDRDVEMFTRSLPSLWNQPGGNEKILHVMRGLATYKQAQGEIADQVLTGEISRQEARQMLRKLPNPLAEAEKPKATSEAINPGDTRTFNGVTYKFNGGDPADPQSWTK